MACYMLPKKEASAVDREHRNEQLGNSSLVEILCQVEVPHPEVGVGQACHESLNQKCLPHKIIIVIQLTQNTRMEPFYRRVPPLP